MYRVKNISTLVLLVIVLLCLTRRADAQQASNTNTCNQPLRDPITHFGIPEAPSHAIASADGCWIFVATTPFSGNGYVGKDGIVVVHRNAGVLQRTRFLPLTGHPFGITLTHDGKLLVVGDFSGQVRFIDVEKLISRAPDSDVALGSFRDGHFAGTSYPSVTADDAYLFLAQWNTAWISVIDLKKARAQGFQSSAIIGGFPTDGWPNGLAVSPDNRRLYVVTRGTDRQNLPFECNGKGRSNNPGPTPVGALLAIDIPRAISNPESSVVASVSAGCDPGRVAVSADGNTVYTASREDDNVLAFDVRPIRNGSPPELIGRIPVGAMPVGVILIDGGKKIVVANSNGYEYDGIEARNTNKDTLSVIDAGAVTKGSASVLGVIPAGTSPRMLSVTADGRTLLVGNLNSLTLELIDLDRLPLQPVKP